MAPKQRGESSKRAGKRPRTDTQDRVEHVGQAKHRFRIDAAELNYRSFKKRPIVPERGMIIEAPFVEYIAKVKWANFIRPPTHGGDRELTFEFYSNLNAEPSNTVFVRGKLVKITPHIINSFYGLQDYPVDDYRQMLEDGVNLSDLMTVLTGSSDGTSPSWTFIKKEALTREAKLIYYFVAARLMPTMVNSEVQKARAILTYAILKGMTVDVGRIIHQEMKTYRDPRGIKFSFGFPALIYRMVRATGYFEESINMSVVRLKAPISFHLLESGARGPRHQDRPEEDDEEEAAPPPVDARFTALEQSVDELKGSVDDLKGSVVDIRGQLVEIQTALANGFDSMREFMEEHLYRHDDRRSPRDSSP